MNQLGGADADKLWQFICFRRPRPNSGTDYNLARASASGAIKSLCHPNGP
jgi:hypothetical protein